MNGYLRFIPVGLAVWFFFFVAIRVLGAAVFTLGNPLLPVMFLAAIPAVIVTIYAISALLRVPMRDMPMPVFVITFTALLLDGVAIAFTPLYGDTPSQIAASAAFLLWGAGLGLVGTLILASRQENPAARTAS